MGPKLSAPENDRYIPARAVWERYGVTHMTLYRWLDSEEMNFPRPRYIGRFRYWKLADLRGWEASRPSVGKPFRRQRETEAVPAK
jgi:predicted DNA-binding transcriptional regulator AlpA